MSKFVDAMQELEQIFNSVEYEMFTQIVENISCLSTATALLGGLLEAWCDYHGEDYKKALSVLLNLKNERRLNHDS